MRLFKSKWIFWPIDFCTNSLEPSSHHALSLSLFSTHPRNCTLLLKTHNIYMPHTFYIEHSYTRFGYFFQTVVWLTHQRAYMGEFPTCLSDCSFARTLSLSPTLLKIRSLVSRRPIGTSHHRLPEDPSGHPVLKGSETTHLALTLFSPDWPCQQYLRLWAPMKDSTLANFKKINLIISWFAPFYFKKIYNNW